MERKRSRSGFQRQAGLPLSGYLEIQNISQRTKMRLFKSNVLSTLRRGAESWKMTKTINSHKPEVFQNRCMLRIHRQVWTRVVCTVTEILGVFSLILKLPTLVKKVHVNWMIVESRSVLMKRTWNKRPEGVTFKGSRISVQRKKKICSIQSAVARKRIFLLFCITILSYLQTITVPIVWSTNERKWQQSSEIPLNYHPQSSLSKLSCSSWQKILPVTAGQTQMGLPLDLVNLQTRSEICQFYRA